RPGSRSCSIWSRASPSRRSRRCSPRKRSSSGVRDLDTRIAALTVDRRRLLARLASRPGTPRQAVAPEAVPVGGESVASFYDAVAASLDATPAGPNAYFLNYGYLDGEEDRAVVPLPERTFDRVSVKLVLELVGDCPIGGRRLLDVGCGRGGTIATLLAYFEPT